MTTYIKKGRKGHPQLTIPIDYKYCPNCRKIKEKSHYHKSNRDKLGVYCRVCSYRMWCRYHTPNREVRFKWPNGSWKNAGITQRDVSILNKMDRHKNLKPLKPRPQDYERFYQYDKIQDDDTNLVERLREGLTKKEKELFDLWIRNVPMRGISSILGITLLSAYNRFYSMRNQLRYVCGYEKTIKETNKKKSMAQEIVFKITKCPQLGEGGFEQTQDRLS